MQILKARVDKNRSYKRLSVLVDKMPDPASLVYVFEKSFWYAMAEGFVAFYYWDGSEKNPDGCSGKTITLRTSDGLQTFKNLGHSRAGVFNRTGLCPCVEVAVSDMLTEYNMDRGCVAHFALPLAEETARLVGVHLKRIDDDGDIVYSIV